MAKPMNKAERAYANWLAEQRCLICGRYDVQLHHEFPAGGRKNHKHLIPLCEEHHKVGNPDARHELGRWFAERHFLEMDGLTCQEWAERSYRQWKER